MAGLFPAIDVYRRAGAAVANQPVVSHALRTLLAVPLLAALIGSGSAQKPARPTLHFNEHYVEEATRATTLAVDDPVAVFGFVFDSLPERVKVYPTENYYYFAFIHAGKPYNGNIRLDATNRDQGKLSFGYSEDLKEWRGELPVMFVLLDGAKGVAVEKLDRLVYRVSYQEKSVVFELNDLSQVKPPVSAIGPDETFIGTIFDESAIRFFLVYNSRLKVFHYILDETVRVADEFVRSQRTDRILIGKRTDFAFYRDHRLDRKIMIGAFEGNIRVNNYFDGPFDQLPDNFIEGDTLRHFILEVEPSLKGKIDRFGGSSDGSTRYAIQPYLGYRSESDLAIFDRCATRKRLAPDYYNCFVIDYDDRDRPRLRAHGLKQPPKKPSPAASR
jgi:hypothetical protein